MKRSLLSLLAAIALMVAIPATIHADSPLSTTTTPIMVTAEDGVAPAEVAEEAAAEEEAGPTAEDAIFRTDNLCSSCT